MFFREGLQGKMSAPTTEIDARLNKTNTHKSYKYSRLGKLPCKKNSECLCI